MKLLLKHSIRSLGRAGEVVEVKPGYARNYLLPHNLAIPATEANVALIEKFKARRAVEEAKLKETYKALAEKVGETEIILNLRANANNMLYGSFSRGDVVTQLNNRHINIEKQMVELEESIKELGEYQINIKFDEETSATLKVSIFNEDGEIPAVEAAPVATVEEKQEEAAEESAEGEAESSEEAEATS